MEIKEALRTLGLEENPTQEQIEQRMSILSRRIRNGEALDAAAISDAYGLLTGKEAAGRKKTGKIAALYRNFMFHYKGWVILSIISIGIIAMIAVPIFFRRIPDLTVSFAGKYGFVDEEIMRNVLSDGMPETEDILVEVMYLDDEGESGEYDAGGRTRLSALIMTEEADILIVDDKAFNFIRSDDALMALDDLVNDLAPFIDAGSYVYGIDFKTGERRIYGLDVSGSGLVYKSIYGADERILCVALRTGHYDEIKKAVEIILTYGE
ncbi:MAG: hypothetical protein JXB33_06665 [Clostridia bacterium]|nr:hypothetical protein [Clostridia bacterium]